MGSPTEHRKMRTLSVVNQWFNTFKPFKPLKPPLFILPVTRGRVRGGLNVLNGWNDLNNECVMRHKIADI
jgi:hypothetical protein